MHPLTQDFFGQEAGLPRPGCRVEADADAEATETITVEATEDTEK